MTAVAVTPITLKNASVSIGGTTYEAAISKITFVPSSSVITFSAVDGSTFTDVTPATWVAEMDYAQDWAEASSLSRLLFDSEGETLVCIFTPVGSGPTVTASIIVTPGSIGGDVGSVAVSSVTMGCAAKPVISAGT